MKQIATEQLTGAALDWAVAKAIGEQESATVLPYSTDWAHGGPIIEREHIALWSEGYDWEAKQYGQHESWAETPLTAAMRCLVASKLGDTVEVPSELIGE